MNKPHFLYKYYFNLPLRREINLFLTVREAKKILRKIAAKKNITKASFEFTEKYNINIHILCSHVSLESFLLSLASFYVFSREYAEIVLHEDGTFTGRDFSIVKSVFPWVKCIPLADADALLRKKVFSDETVRLRHKHKLLIKAIDFHYIEPKERILIIDTDLFILGLMSELWDNIKEGKEFVFNEDPKPIYGSAKVLLEESLGVKLVDNKMSNVNTGLIVEPSLLIRENREIIERYCNIFGRSNKFYNLHAVEQGFIAYFLIYKGIEGYPLSNKYMIAATLYPDDVKRLKEYDLKLNSDSLETMHLCGWDKTGEDFQIIKRRLLYVFKEKSS